MDANEKWKMTPVGLLRFNAPGKDILEIFS